MKRSLISLTLGIISLTSFAPYAVAAPPRTPDKQETCEVLVVGGGLAGAATAYEGLLAGRTVCLTEITDWVGGQISSQGTSALDERPTQRSRLFYSRGYLELRERIKNYYGKLNPGGCWVSESCFLPRDADKILERMLKDAAKRGKGTLKWYPSTVVKELNISANGKQIESAIAIQHQPTKGAPPLNT
ncbi:FAD-dependent oxidoreductase, partial [Allocoleopsis sp.]|uniref:FAD-dependent oxidoreductase n=1 Tax=Allocoleopsis sp. TaxID=3088169 RepID=UPI002FD2D5CB